MDTLYTEIYGYLKTYLPNTTLTEEAIIPLVSNYGDYIKTIIPRTVPHTLYKYINIPLMIHDLHEDGHILIFCFSLHEDNDTISSNIEYDLPEHTQGFINGVKMLDEYDIREQITANQYTGGYWDERIHWIVDLRSFL